MPAKAAKIIVQVIGTVIGLLAVPLPFRVQFLFQVRDWLACAVIGLLAIYCAYIGFSTWRKFTRSLIWHTIGVGLFWILLVGHALIVRFADSATVKQYASGFLLILLIWFYSEACRYLTGRIFGAADRLIG
jgi:hypothetical protein